MRWRDSVDRVEELEGEVAELRRRFYMEDDPFYRDSQIKPAWDRSLDQLTIAKDEVVAAKEDLDELLEEGRRQGALPGWLREGIEFEPVIEVEEANEPRTGPEPIEPEVLNEG